MLFITKEDAIYTCLLIYSQGDAIYSQGMLFIACLLFVAQGGAIYSLSAIYSMTAAFKLSAIYIV